MSNELILIENLHSERLPVPIEIRAFTGQARDYADQARSVSTRRSYAGDVRSWISWCEVHNACPLPASAATLLAYLIDGAERLKVSTLRRHLTAIREYHAVSGYAVDTASAAFKDTWRGIQRVKGCPANKKSPLMTADLRRAVEALPATLTGKRDRAILLIGFAAALRRSELASLEVTARDGASRIEDRPDGLVVFLSRSKTDQGGVGTEVGIPFGSNPATCPVRNFRAWLKAAKIKTGPAFRPITRHGKLGEKAITGRAVARIVKRAIVAQAMADGASRRQAEQRAEAFSGHSLRSGLATSAAANDAPGHAIQKQLRHKRFDTTAGYIRTGQLFKQNAAGMAGL
ncbi:site-specific integrase [Methylobacterium sp. J-059]|uniref:site-specific integrase n=1 Tax=Methylobacterium sp. J-059 TaxID=2836643 RepID=UPI001FB8DEFE|nr:site-specific integrase [Methylobacterium sp. J-059]MCJ2038257.1 site-specific integrase [Methylobacterium sp. J-059]